MLTSHCKETKHPHKNLR